MLITETRARVYLVWALLLPIGFVATHLYQRHAINALWTIIAIVGLGYMYRVMPIKVRQMQHILWAWLAPIGFGLLVSAVVFYVDTANAATLIAHLGAFWLGIMAVGYFLNGLADSSPRGWYWFAGALNLAAAVACWTIEPFIQGQYLIAAIVSAWSMLNLWIFRS